VQIESQWGLLCAMIYDAIVFCQQAIMQKNKTRQVKVNGCLKKKRLKKVDKTNRCCV
jgi:hypothetical protein